jgi:hypothetical protein
MPATITVPYSIMHNGRNESVDTNGVYATMVFLVDWSDRWQFIRDVAGKSVIVGPSSGPTIVRSAPLQYPDNKNLYANGVSVEPIGVSYCTTSGAYAKAEITVTFGTLSFDSEVSQGTQNTVYRSIEIDMSAQLMSLPTSPFEFATPSGGFKPNTNQVNPGLLMPQAQITITSHQVPYLDTELIFGFIGSINLYTFYGMAPGTCLFLGVQCRRQATSEGLQAWEISYRFSFRPIDWNKFYSPTPGVGFDFLYHKATSTTIYSYMDFTFIP